MDVNEALRRLAHARPGMRLLHHREVAIPLLRLTLDVVVEEHKDVPPIEEYILRSINAGLATLDDVSAFLGLQRRLVEAAVHDLWNRDNVDLVAGNLRLTDSGREVMDDLVARTPVRQEASIDFDRVLYEVRGPAAANLMKPRDLSEQALQDLPLPRGHAKRPTIQDLAFDDVAVAVKRALQGARRQAEVLAVRGVVRADRVFEHGLVLVYGVENGDDLTFAIAVDGRLSPEHEEAFGRAGGAERLGLDLDKLVSERVRLAEITSPELVEQAVPEDKVAAVERAIVELEREVRGTQAEAQEPLDHRHVAELRTELDDARRQLDAMVVRRLQVYEHPVLLRDCLVNARQRLLIISPWISSAVVDDDFTRSLDALCRRGVDVHIGFGISEDDRGARRRHDRAERRLRGIASRYSNFTFRELGYTHAKVLICDDLWVATSFNWLSFRGDPDRTFRQEEGLLVRIPEKVESAYQEFREQIGAAEDIP